MAPQVGEAFCFTHNPRNESARASINTRAGVASGKARRRIAANRRARREEAISLFNHSPRCVCIVCTLVRCSAPPLPDAHVTRSRRVNQSRTNRKTR